MCNSRAIGCPWALGRSLRDLGIHWGSKDRQEWPVSRGWTPAGRSEIGFVTGARSSYFSESVHLQVCFALWMSNVGLCWFLVCLFFFPLLCCCWTLPLRITLFKPAEMPSCKESKHRKFFIMKFSRILKDKSTFAYRI